MKSAARHACVYRCETRHERLKPFRRSLRYKITQLFLDIDHLDETVSALRLFSRNRFNLFSFHDSDHGALGAASLRDWAQTMFAQAGVDAKGGKIMLLCMPRMLGFAFNPLSVFLAYAKNGALNGVLYEVRNTFQERHVYVVRATPNGRATAAKSFHVSPFFDVRGRYAFRLQPPAATFFLSIANETQDGVEHVATLRGARAPLTDLELLRTFFLAPFMTLGVVIAIHWEALFLWLRGARYRRKPPAPAIPFTAGDIHLSESERLELSP